ncbi:dermonecrotic toxin domain-containing protein [Pseudomonas sp. NA-150]|uniref:dermonecrotic toxin domain-containing protein n=1 Tax=Pseudomonas sp. NA-150 TaxID=3367525 RepID=UPI0037CB989B
MDLSTVSADDLAYSSLRYYIAQSVTPTQSLNQLHAACTGAAESAERLRALTGSAPISGQHQWDAWWQGLAPGFTGSRQVVAAQQRRQNLAHKAVLARLSLMLGDDGLALVQRVYSATQPRVFMLKANAAGQALAGAFVIESADRNDLPLVLVMPGNEVEFCEFESREDLREGLEHLLQHAVEMEYLPLAPGQDVFQKSIDDSLRQRTAPLAQLVAAQWLKVINDGLDQDAELFASMVSFGSLSPALPARLTERKPTVYEQRIEAWCGAGEGETEARVEYRRCHDQLKATEATTRTLSDSFRGSAENPLSDFSTRYHSALVEQRRQGLLAEARLQHYEATLTAVELTALEQLLAPQNASPSPLIARELALMAGDAQSPINGALVFVFSASALLYLPGEGGGLQKFSSLQALKDDVEFSLQSGLETPLWRQVSPHLRAMAMRGSARLIDRAVTASPIAHSVQTQLDGAANALQAARSGQRLYDDEQTLEATQARLHLEWVGNLQMPANEARDRAIDQLAEQRRTGALPAQLPRWLLDAKAEVRHQYARQLADFHAAAAVLERRLDGELPPFEVFVRQRLAVQIQADLGRALDADQVILDLPKTVSRQWQIDQQVGTTLHSKVWQAGAEREQISLSDLARYNIDPGDEEQVARLSFARISYALPHESGFLEGLTDRYLVRVIPQMDVAQHYRTLLKRVFSLRAGITSQDRLDNEVLLTPYEFEILLEGFVARQRSQLTDDGYRVLDAAARARSRNDLNAAHLQMNWIVFKPGTAISGENNSQTFSGLCVIHQRMTGKTLVYLPQAPGGVSLSEANSLAEARERLIQRLIKEPRMVSWLVSRLEESRAPAADVRYIEQALIRKFDGFITFVPALDLQMTLQQFHVREWLLYQQTQVATRSGHDIRRARTERTQQHYMMYLKALLSFVPGLGTLISVNDGWHDGHLAAEAFRQGRNEEGGALTFSTTMCVMDVLLSVVPGAVTVTALAKVARRATKLRQLARIRQALPAVSRKRYVTLSFEGYDADISLQAARPQTGKDVGTWLLDGQLWIKHEGKSYRVYRRSGEQTLRLKKTATHTYEPPVRFVEGRWLYHTDVGLKGGVGSNIAEVMMCRNHPDPDFTRVQARQLLDQFAFPPDRQRRLELSLAFYYRTHKRVPDWAQAYRRSAIAGSSGQLPSAPRHVAATSVPSADVDVWKRWGRRVDDPSTLDQVAITPPTFRVVGTPEREMVLIGTQYHEVLPPGAIRHTNIVFLTNPDAPIVGFVGLDDIIQNNRYQQPAMASYTAGRWTFHRPVFRKNLHQMVAEARPGFTPASQQALAEKLFNLADNSGSTLTSSRLIAMRATLNAWRRGENAPFSRLNDPLRMLEGIRPEGEIANALHLKVSYGSSIETFSRLDFLIESPLEVELLTRAIHGVGSVSDLRVLMLHVLNRGGYEVVERGIYAAGRPIMLFRRPGQPELYLLYLRHSRGSSLKLYKSTETLNFPMSNAWIDSVLADPINALAVPAVQQARQEGKLIKLLGGTNSVSPLESGKQVLVLRIADDF